MTTRVNVRLLPALLGLAVSGTASASGFQLLEQNASGLGNAYAGSAAVAENASTVFFNPAGMAQLQDREVSVGATYISPSYKFSNDASSTGVLTGDNVDGGKAGTVPNAYLSWALGNDLHAGIGVGAPFGLATKYDQGWMGGAQSLEFDIETLNINPSIAWKMSDTVSLGIGLDYQSVDAQYTRQAAVVSPLYAATILDLKLTDEAWGWNAGALFTVAPETKIGVAYRSAMAFTGTGDIDVSAAGTFVGSAPVSADLKFPDTFILSATHRTSDRLELLGDVSWTGWSCLTKVDIVYKTAGTVPAPHNAGDTAQTLETDFRDTWRVAVGANYRISDATTLKMGLAYDQTPVKDADSRMVSLPDNDRTWLSLGGQWKVASASTIDLGAAYLFVKDADIHNNQASAGRGLVDGTYKNNAWMVGGQYSVAF